jgi:hypothetical protein
MMKHETPPPPLLSILSTPPPLPHPPTHPTRAQDEEGETFRIDDDVRGTQGWR